jgi:hypothetical protein
MQSSPHINPDTRIVAALLVAAAVVYSFFMPVYYVGLLNDDATYIVGALSLLHGRYAALYQLGEPPLTFYPPGFSLLLTPFVGWVQPHWGLLKAIPAALTLLNGFLFYRLLRGWLSNRMRLLAVTLYLFNPGIVVASTLILSEPLFTTCTLISFLMLRRILAGENSSAAVLGLVVGYAAEVRLVGILLIPAVIVGLLFARRYRALLPFAVCAGIISAYFPLRNHFLTHSATGYASPWKTSLMEIIHPARFLDNLTRTTYSLFPHTLLSINLPHNGLGIALTVAIAVCIGIIVWAGLRSWNSIPRSRQALYLSILTLIVFWFGVHALWTAINRRYWLPVLPLWIALVVAGTEALFNGYPKAPRWIAVTLALAWVVIPLREDLNTWIHVHQAVPESFTGETWAWIQHNISPDANILYAAPAQLYLYTGRKGSGIIQAESPAAFQDAIVANRLTHVLIHSFAIQTSGENPNRLWMQNQAWTMSMPKVFQVLYQNKPESTAIYKVLPITQK